jgi:glutaredoxin 3
MTELSLREAKDSMPDIVVYTKPLCPYCARALALLDKKGVKVTEIEAGFDPELRRQMIEKSGRSTYPQIFIDGKHIGGCDDLMALDRAGGLDPLLTTAD